MQTIEELRARLGEIGERFKTIAAEQGTLEFTQEAQNEWDSLKEERALLERRISQYEERMKVVQELARDERHVEMEETTRTNGHRDRTSFGAHGVRVPSDLWDISGYRDHNPYEKVPLAMREGARRAVDQMTFPHESADQAAQQERIERLIDQIDGEDAVLSRHILMTGSPLYARAFGKYLYSRPLSAEEDNALKRAASLTTTAGGFAVPVALDPTVIATSNGAINPLRQISRVVTITGNTWEGVSSTGITASFAAEATETTDNAPVFLQPTANVEKAQALVPFSIEIGEDWASFQSEMATMLQDAKDALECEKFTNGYGHTTNTPEGYLKGGTSIVTSAATATLAVADLFTCKNALPARFRPNAVWVAEGTQLDRIRNLGTTYGSSFWTELGNDRPPNLIGKPVYENSAAPSATTTATSAVTYGDFTRGFLIVDRVGLSVELIPHLTGTTANYPSGQRGLYAYWRTTSKVVAMQALKTIKLL